MGCGLDCEGGGGKEGGGGGNTVGGDGHGGEWRHLKENSVTTMAMQVGLMRGKRIGLSDM